MKTINVWSLAVSYSDGSEGIELFDTELAAVQEMVCTIQGMDSLDPEQTEAWDSGDGEKQKAWAKEQLTKLQGGDLDAGRELIEDWASEGTGEVWWILSEIQLPMSTVFSDEVCSLLNAYQKEEEGETRYEIKLNLADQLLSDLGIPEHTGGDPA